MPSGTNSWRSPWLPALLGAALLALGGLAVGGCGDEEDAAGGDEAVEARDEDEVGGGARATLAQVLRHTDEFLGQEVAVTGEVQEVVVDPGVFTLGAEEDVVLGREGRPGQKEGEALEQEEQAVGEDEGEERLVVLARSGVEVGRGELAPGEIVRVEGTVTRVSRDVGEEAELLVGEDAGEADEVLAELEGRPAILAAQVDAAQPR